MSDENTQLISEQLARFVVWTKFEDIPEEYAGLGGRALTSTIVAREVNPICTPLGPHNKLVFAPGLLGATNSPNSNRISVGCKSPLTEGIKESNSGGQPGGHLAKLGILAIIVEDMATEGEWWQLEISKDSAKLVPSTVAGLNNFDAVDKLVEQYGKECSYVTIGRAGEYPAEIFRDRSDVNPRSIFVHTRSRTRENRCETVTQKRRLQSTENPSQRETTLRRLRKNPSPGDMFGSTVTRNSSAWKTVPLL